MCCGSPSYAVQLKWAMRLCGLFQVCILPANFCQLYPILYCPRDEWGHCLTEKYYTMTPRQYQYEYMLTVVYFVNGVLLLVGSNDLPGSRYLLSYTIVGHLFNHGAIMLVEVLLDFKREVSHFMILPVFADIPLLFLLSAVFAYLKYFYDREVLSAPAPPAGSAVAPAGHAAQTPAERQLAWAMRIIGFAVAFLYAPAFYVLRHGWLWHPQQYEYEWMILAWNLGLGLVLMLGARDLGGSRHLLNFAIWGEPGGHGVLMLVQTLLDWEAEKEHVMLYGSVPVKILSAATLLVLKARWDAERRPPLAEYAVAGSPGGVAASEEELPRLLSAGRKAPRLEGQQKGERAVDAPAGPDDLA